MRWELRLNGLLRTLVACFSSSREGSTEAYSLVGTRLYALARCSRSSFRETVAEIAARIITSRITRFESALNAFNGEPRPWTAKLEVALGYLAASRESIDLWLPREFSEAGEDHAEWLRRAYVDDSRRLLAAWPSMLESSRDYMAERSVL